MKNKIRKSKLVIWFIWWKIVMTFTLKTKPELFFAWFSFVFIFNGVITFFTGKTDLLILILRRKALIFMELSVLENIWRCVEPGKRIIITHSAGPCVLVRKSRTFSSHFHCLFWHSFHNLYHSTIFYRVIFYLQSCYFFFLNWIFQMFLIKHNITLLTFYCCYFQ